jgi:adenylate cyclase
MPIRRPLQHRPSSRLRREAGPHRPRQFLQRLALLALIPALWCVLGVSGQLGFLDDHLTDLRFRARGELRSPVKLIYVDIDNEAIQTFRWPWNHSRYAQLLDALFDHGKVKAVGFDLVFSDNARADFGIEEQEEGRRQFGKSIHRHRSVVLATNYVPGPGLIQERREFPWIFDGFTDPAKNDTPELPGFPILGPSWGVPGLIDTWRGGLRAAPAFADTPVGTFHPMALQLALLELGLSPDSVHRFPDRLELRRPDGGLVSRIPLRQGQIIDTNWFSRWESPLNQRCSVVDVGLHLAGLESADPAEQQAARDFFAPFRDAIVLIGAVDPLLQDLGTTPFDDHPVPRVGFHGNLLKTLLGGLHPTRLPPWGEHLLTFALGLGVIALVLAPGRTRVRPNAWAAVVVTGYSASCFAAFSSVHLVLPMAAPLGATLLGWLAAIAWRLVEEQQAKHRIKGMFGTYVSPELVDRMVESGESPRLGGHEAELTCYFSDIEGFSRFSEQLPPDKLVELMNEYLTACTEVILGQGAALDKYIGDAVVAMFGGLVPHEDHGYRACLATQLVALKLEELKEKWRAEGAKWPAVVGSMRTRIGLNTGTVTIGNMGSPARFNFTMMGDNVNLAARMESGAKAYGVFHMVTAATRDACIARGGDRIVFRPLDRIVVKGRATPVDIHEIVALRERIDDRTLECIDHFERGLSRYFAMDWDGATACFHRSAALEPNQAAAAAGGGPANPSQVMLARCAGLRLDPPPHGWDGVFVMKEK